MSDRSEIAKLKEEIKRLEHGMVETEKAYRKEKSLKQSWMNKYFNDIDNGED